MRKWVIIVLTVALLAAVGVIGWQMFKPSDEPVHKGKTMTSWLRERRNNGVNSAETIQQAEQALRDIGTNSIPTLLALLRATNSPLKLKLMRLAQRQRVIKIHIEDAGDLNSLAMDGFHVLGTNGQAAVPALIEIVNEDFSEVSQIYAVWSLGDIGPSAKPIVPLLLSWATNAYELQWR
jgi:hypothetical protein